MASSKGSSAAPRAGPATPPRYTPTLAVAGSVPEPAADFAFEVKWDGVRTLIYLDVGGMRVLTREGANLTDRFPELAPLAGALPGRVAVLDGEVVAFGADGRPSFTALQSRLHLTRPAAVAARARTRPVVLMIFDVLYLDGDLTGWPYQERRRILEGLGVAGGAVQVPPAWIGDSAAALEFTRRHQLEGLIAKRLTSRYAGTRSRNWIKVKHVRSEDFRVGGWIQSAAAVPSVKALLVGTVQEDRTLRYASAVGTGFAQAERRQLAEALSRISRRTSPFVELGPDARREARWVEPVLICAVEYLERTPGGRLRHPIYRGLRLAE